jgi:hypothetical protein
MIWYQNALCQPPEHFLSCMRIVHFLNSKTKSPFSCQKNKHTNTIHICCEADEQYKCCMTSDRLAKWISSNVVCYFDCMERAEMPFKGLLFLLKNTYLAVLQYGTIPKFITSRKACFTQWRFVSTTENESNVKCNNDVQCGFYRET